MARTVDFHGDAAEMIDHLSEITERQRNEVVSDAFRTYLWVLYQQLHGKKVVPMVDDKPEKPIQSFVKNTAAAEEYFRDLKWPVPA